MDTLTVQKNSGKSIESIEMEIRTQLGAEGHTLPWDNTGNRLGRPGPGVPGTRLPSRLSSEGYRWEGERLVKNGAQQ